MRLGPQVQTLLSGEGRRTGGCCTGPSRSRGGCSITRDCHVGSHARTKAPHGPAVEGDHVSWVHPAHADAPQSRWQLNDAILSNLLALNPRPEHTPATRRDAPGWRSSRSLRTPVELGCQNGTLAAWPRAKVRAARTRPSPAHQGRLPRERAKSPFTSSLSVDDGRQNADDVRRANHGPAHAADNSLEPGCPASA